MSIDALIRGRIEERLQQAVPEIRVSRYLPLSPGPDGTVALAPEMNSNAVFSAVIDRTGGQLSANQSGFITGSLTYRVYYAEALQSTAALPRHAQFHERLDAIVAHLLSPPRLNFDPREPRDNPLRNVDALSFDVSLGEGATASARQHVLTAQIELTLSVYWQPEVNV